MQDSRPARVLVVEDEVLVQMLVLEVLDELGFEALEANDAPSALDILRDGAAPDLLVTDVGLPGMNGRELAKAARALHPDLPILFVTGYAERQGPEGISGPGVDTIVKPFSLDALGAKIQEMAVPR